MKKVVTTITAAIFALGLVSAGLAQPTQTPVKPEVKKESTTVQTPAPKPEVTKPEAVKPEAAKPGEKPAAKEAVKPIQAKKDAKKAKKDKTEKKSGAPVEKSQPEKK